MIDPELHDDGPNPITPRTLRQFAAIWLVFFGALALWQGWWRENTTWGVIFAVLGGPLGLLGLLHPPLIRPVFTGLITLTYPIGWVVSNVILAGMYYLLFTPVALVFKLIGRDALQLRRPDRPTYWTPQPTPENLQSYFRQS